MSSYDTLGTGYTSVRRADPRIAAQIRAALGDGGTVINVGAGAGSYEPEDLATVAVEPSPVMIRQRTAGAAPVVRAVAESLPFASGTFRSGMAVLTIHHWNDLASGLIELRRVVTGAIAVVCWDAQVFNRYWMVAEYLPESRALDTHVPSPTVIADILGGGHVEVLPVPADCADGFYAAWWRRPEAYLDPAVRAGISGIARLPADRVQPAIDELRSDLASGRWLRKHGHLLQLDAFDAGYRLVVATPQAP